MIRFHQAGLRRWEKRERLPDETAIVVSGQARGVPAARARSGGFLMQLDLGTSVPPGANFDSRRQVTMNVEAVMTRNVKFAGSNATLADAARVMAESNCGAVPIIDNEKRVVGMITDRDICLAMATATRLASQIPVEKVMAKRVFSCGPEDDLETALQTMQSRKVRRLPVIGDDGKLQGILSMDDVVVHAEVGAGKRAPEIGYGRTVETLKAIYRRGIQARPLPV